MKTFIKTTLVALVFGLMAPFAIVQPADAYYYTPYQESYDIYSTYGFDKEAYYQYLVSQYNKSQTYTFNPYTTYQQPVYHYDYNGTPGYTYQNVNPYSGSYTYSSNNDRPDVSVRSARDIEDDSAELRGEVDMNGTRNGIVFFVYGQDEDAIEDVQHDYDEYHDVKDDEEDDDFEVEKVDSDLDDDETYEEKITGLEEGEEYFFVLCVEYRDGRDRLECSDVENFDTNGDSNDDNPNVNTNTARDIEDDSAELRGEVEMNDFDNGRVFFVWGEDEDQIEDIEDEDRYSDINQDGDNLQKITVDSDLDGGDDYIYKARNLDDNTNYYFRICVEYQDDGNDDTLECGDVRYFETD